MRVCVIVGLAYAGLPLEITKHAKARRGSGYTVPARATVQDLPLLRPRLLVKAAGVR